MLPKIYHFKGKDSKITTYPLFLGNISIDFSVNYMKKAELNWYVYHFSVHYCSFDVGTIQDIHKYLTNKNNMK